MVSAWEKVLSWYQRWKISDLSFFSHEHRANMAIWQLSKIVPWLRQRFFVLWGQVLLLRLCSAPKSERNIWILLKRSLFFLWKVAFISAKAASVRWRHSARGAGEERVNSKIAYPPEGIVLRLATAPIKRLFIVILWQFDLFGLTFDRFWCNLIF